MANLRIRVRSLKLRDDTAIESLTDDQVGEALVGVLARAMDRGGAPPVALGLRADRVDLFDLKPLVEQKVPLPHFITALTRNDFRAVGLMGRFRRTTRTKKGAEPQVSMAMVFLEWEDCRWWQWHGLADDAGGLVDDTVTVRRAIDGDPMPAGLGRWWSRARMGGMRVQVAPAEKVH